MKNVIFTIVFSAVCLQISYGQDDPPPRDVLAVSGVPDNSLDWDSEIENMRGYGYLIREVFSPTLFDYNATLPINQGNLKDMVQTPIHDFEDVLGLGHDVGGLALRGLKAEDTRVTGQVLVGTPNRGSKFLRAINFNTTDNKSSIEVWLDNLERWKGGVDCPDCEVPQALLEYVLENKNQPYSLGARDDPNAYYQTLPEVDIATTAVIWGNAEGQTLADFMTSRGGSLIGVGEEDKDKEVELQDCQDRLKAIKEAEIEQSEEVQLINGIFNIGGSVISQVETLLAQDSITLQSLSASGFFGSVIELIGSTWVQNIEANEDLSQEKKDLMICEAANRMLETKWMISIAGGQPDFDYDYVEGPQYDEELCEYYTYECQYNTFHPNHPSFCYYAEDVYCLQEVVTVTYEPNDFVYSMTEQNLAELPLDSDYVFEIQANHFEEQSYLDYQDTYDAIFIGTLGPEFNIPQL